MELDKRIIEGKHPLTCFDTKQAQNFVGKKCYLTNDISIFSDLDSFKDTEGCSDAPYVGVIDRLTNINKELSMVFDTTFLRWKFCIPCEWVQLPKAPEFVPYTLDTWEQDFKPGDTVVFRDKEDATEYKFVYSGYIKHPNNLISVSFGPYLYTFYDLFNSYEIYRNGNWEPFGVIDE